MKALFTPVPKLIKARQLNKVQQIVDKKTGQMYIGQIGDWVIKDQCGYLFIMTYYEFISRYMPYNLQALELFQTKQQVYKKRGSLMVQIEKNIKESGGQKNSTN